jgi:hypothetical protein
VRYEEQIPTVTDRHGRDDLQVRVASVQELLVDSIALVRVHDTHPVDVWVGEVPENPLPSRSRVLGVHNQVEPGLLQDGSSIRTDRSGAEVSEQSVRGISTHIKRDGIFNEGHDGRDSRV